jgi:hypothetical protein
VLGAAGETETTQENIQDWLELYEGDLGFQLPTEEEMAADVIKDSATDEGSDNEQDELQESITFICFLFLCVCFRAIFCFINPDDLPAINLD